MENYSLEKRRLVLAWASSPTRYFVRVLLDQIKLGNQASIKLLLAHVAVGDRRVFWLPDRASRKS